MIQIRGLEFQGRHGASAAERKTHRRFQVDVDIAADLERPASSDRLADTVNYYEVCAIVHEIGTGAPFKLIEALCGAILGAICARWPGAVVTVEVRKLNPACPGNPQYSAVRLTDGGGKG